MKTLKTILLVILTITLFASCDNDDGNDPNENQCDYQGLTFVDTSDNTQILIPEASLNTQFFPNASNGPFGVSGVEIAGTAPNGDFIFFTTDAITVGAIGTVGEYYVNSILQNGPVVTCQRAGTTVGEEFRYDLSYGSIESEFCVIIDEVL